MLLFIYICSVIVLLCACLALYTEAEEVNLVEAIGFLLLAICPILNTVITVACVFVLILDKLSKVKIKEKKTE